MSFDVEESASSVSQSVCFVLKDRITKGSIKTRGLFLSVIITAEYLSFHHLSENTYNLAEPEDVLIWGQCIWQNLLSFLLFPGPPLVILEFVPHGDLLGYLKKSKGEKDNYYNLRNKESMPSKITEQQLYQFARDIACGMEFLSAHQVCYIYIYISFKSGYRMLIGLKQQYLTNVLIRVSIV